MQRELAGPMQPWDLNALLLRRIELQLAGANWQRGGGKSSQRPKPIELPDGKAKPKKADGAATAQRLLNLGMIPAGAMPAPAESPAE